MAVSENELVSIKRYKQSAPSLASTMSLPIQAFVDPLPDQPAPGIWTPNGISYSSPDNTAFWYWDFEQDKQMVEKILKIMEKDPHWIQKQIKKHNLAAQGLEKRVARIVDSAAAYSEHDKQASIQTFESFLTKEHERWSASLFIDLFDPFEKEILYFVFGKQLEKIEPKDLQTLLLPDKTFLWEEQEELEKIKTVFIQQNKQQSPQVEKLLQKHATKYWWIQNSYQSVQKLDEKYFFNRLLEKSGPSFMQKVKQEKQRILSKYAFDAQTVDRLQQFVDLTFFRDIRKKFTLIANFGVISFFHMIAQKQQIPVEHSDFVISFYEYRKFIEKDSAFVKELAERAKKGVLIIGSNQCGQFRIETQKAPERFKQIESSFFGEQLIYGMIASLGKTAGKAKIILNLNEFSKFEEGDVLITGMTRPEFVPLMKKAAAIVTDEGGITSHAAIVSRELGKPCIIGTQSATKTFKDGDWVEVNANHGFVQKLEKKHDD